MNLWIRIKQKIKKITRSVLKLLIEGDDYATGQLIKFKTTIINNLSRVALSLCWPCPSIIRWTEMLWKTIMNTPTSISYGICLSIVAKILINGCIIIKQHRSSRLQNKSKIWIKSLPSKELFSSFHVYEFPHSMQWVSSDNYMYKINKIES